MNSDICQLRLDLDAFDLAETATPDGTCIDTFDVTTGSFKGLLCSLWYSDWPTL